MNAKETLELISKQWCNTQDLMKISQLGINNATKIRKQIREELISQGYMLPKGLIPMAKVGCSRKFNKSFFCNTQPVCPDSSKYIFINYISL